MKNRDNRRKMGIKELLIGKLWLIGPYNYNRSIVLLIYWMNWLPPISVQIIVMKTNAPILKIVCMQWKYKELLSNYWITYRNLLCIPESFNSSI